jgi:hypothetical protein
VQNGNPVFWNLQQTASTFLAVPATLTATTVGFGLNGANTTGGTYTGASTYHACIAYVDVAGQVGACSADFSALTAGSGTTNQIGFSAPAASAGAVGYVVYISLAGGTYSLAYQAPLTSSQCTLTKIETVTPACAVANATYGQSGSAAIISALTLNTSPVDMQLGGVSGTLSDRQPERTHDLQLRSELASRGQWIDHRQSGVHRGRNRKRDADRCRNREPSRRRHELRRENHSRLRQVPEYGRQLFDPEHQAVLGCGGIGSRRALRCRSGRWRQPALVRPLPMKARSATPSPLQLSGAGVPLEPSRHSVGFLEYALVSSGNVVGNGADTKAAAVSSLNLAGGAGFETRLSIVHTNTTGNATAQLQSLTIEVL